MEQQQSQYRPGRLLRLPDVLERVPLARSKIYRLIAQRRFPAPVKVDRAALWREGDIDQWIAEAGSQAGVSSRDEAAMLDERRLAQRLGVSVSTLQKDRLRRQPKFPFTRVGRSVRYRWADVQSALANAQEVSSCRA